MRKTTRKSVIENYVRLNLSGKFPFKKSDFLFAKSSRSTKENGKTRFIKVTFSQEAENHLWKIVKRDGYSFLRVIRRIANVALNDPEYIDCILGSKEK